MWGSAKGTGFWKMVKAVNRVGTIKEENRVLNQEIELQYFVVSAKDKMSFLLCNATVAAVNSYSMKQHYETQRGHKI
jgi:hypothetical protein